MTSVEACSSAKPFCCRWRSLVVSSRRQDDTNDMPDAAESHGTLLLVELISSDGIAPRLLLNTAFRLSRHQPVQAKFRPRSSQASSTASFWRLSAEDASVQWRSSRRSDGANPGLTWPCGKESKMGCSLQKSANRLQENPPSRRPNTCTQNCLWFPSSFSTRLPRSRHTFDLPYRSFS